MRTSLKKKQNKTLCRKKKKSGISVPSQRDLRLLLVEDSETDATLLLYMLRDFGFNVYHQRVENELDFSSALVHQEWDIVISDYFLPYFTGLDALRLFKKSGLDIPFFIVSGAIGEDLAVSAMKAGADDYFMKGNLNRLMPVIEKEINALKKNQEYSQVKEALHESQEWQSLLLQSMPVILYSASLNKYFERTWFSPNMEKITGYSKKDFSDTVDFWESRIHPKDRDKVFDEFRKIKEKGTVTTEYRWKCAEGVYRWILDHATLHVDKQNKKSIAGSCLDIDKRKQLEEQFRQSHKMEAIGRLAGGVSHDFNNLLTAISGYSELAMKSIQLDNPAYEDLEEIKKAVQRAGSLTRQLLAFSRKQALDPKVLDLNTVITDMNKMLKRMIGEDIELFSDLDTQIGRVKADVGQIEQVIMNLVVNARDAMPRGGKLILETANETLDSSYNRQYREIRPGPYVRLTIRDTGTGIDEVTKGRLFEPFFTTKPQGKGTGLGLATVYGIVKQSEGHIFVESSPKQGAAFHLYLPLCYQKEENIKTISTTKESLRGNETILVVEDEAAVLDMARRVLLRNGYNVLEAKNAGEALLLCENHTGKIDFMLSDIVMPQMNGLTLVKRLLPLHPEMKILFMSGYTDPTVIQQEIYKEGRSILFKPFRPDELALKVREILSVK